MEKIVKEIKVFQGAECSRKQKVLGSKVFQEAKCSRDSHVLQLFRTKFNKTYIVHGWCCCAASAGKRSKINQCLDLCACYAASSLQKSQLAFEQRIIK